MTASEETRARLMTAGFSGCIWKPIDTRSFGPTVEAFLIPPDAA